MVYTHAQPLKDIRRRGGGKQKRRGEEKKIRDGDEIKRKEGCRLREIMGKEGGMKTRLGEINMSLFDVPN